MTTKTTKTVFLSTILLAVSISLVFGTSYAIEGKDILTELVSEPTSFSEKDPTKDFEEFTDSQIMSYRLQIESDPEISALMADGDYEYSSIAYRLDPIVTVFDITYKNEKGTRITVGFEDGEITESKKYESKGKWSHRGFVIKYYDDSYAAKGIGHNFELPSSFSTTDTNDINVILTNAVKDGSDLVNDSLCDSDDSPDTYWGQSGIQFSNDGIEAGWTDTEEECDPTMFLLTVNAGDEITSRVYLDDSVSNKWWMTVDNLDDGYGPYGTSKIITGSTEILTDEPNTSVWWETTYTPGESNWASDFGSDIVSDWASYKYTNNSWYLWGSEVQDTSHCEPTANPTSVVSGAFDTGNRDVTWDVSDIEDDCGS